MRIALLTFHCQCMSCFFVVVFVLFCFFPSLYSHNLKNSNMSPHRIWNTVCQGGSILFLAIDQIPRVSLCGQSVWTWNQQTDKKHKIHLICPFWNIILCADRHQHSIQTGIASDVIEQMHTCDNIQSSLCSVLIRSLTFSSIPSAWQFCWVF